MAGSLPVALSQQMDANGQPLAGCLLYIYQAGTVSTPQDAFQDAGLTILHPWPLEADQNGRIPMFYLADGSVKVRLTDADGVVQFDYPEMLVIGPSGGSTPGPGVDATTVFQTGDVKWRPSNETLSGFVRLNGLTIGSATSGASERANADTQSLFLYLWGQYSDTLCPVSGGRGASAAADWASNKRIGLLDMRLRGPFGLDDMGAAAAGRSTGATFTVGNATTQASVGGEAAHTLSVSEMPSHDHGGATGNPTTHPNLGLTGTSQVQSVANPGHLDVQPPFITLPDHVHTITAQGGGGAHNSMPPFMLGTWFMRL